MDRRARLIGGGDDRRCGVRGATKGLGAHDRHVPRPEVARRGRIAGQGHGGSSRVAAPRTPVERSRSPSSRKTDSSWIGSSRCPATRRRTGGRRRADVDGRADRLVLVTDDADGGRVELAATDQSLAGGVGGPSAAGRRDAIERCGGAGVAGVVAARRAPPGRASPTGPASRSWRSSAGRRRAPWMACGSSGSGSSSPRGVRSMTPCRSPPRRRGASLSDPRPWPLATAPRARAGPRRPAWRLRDPRPSPTAAARWARPDRKRPGWRPTSAPRRPGALARQRPRPGDLPRRRRRRRHPRPHRPPTRRHRGSPREARGVRSLVRSVGRASRADRVCGDRRPCRRSPRARRPPGRPRVPPCAPLFPRWPRDRWRSVRPPQPPSAPPSSPGAFTFATARSSAASACRSRFLAFRAAFPLSVGAASVAAGSVAAMPAGPGSSATGGACRSRALSRFAILSAPPPTTWTAKSAMRGVRARRFRVPAVRCSQSQRVGRLTSSC